MTLEYKVDNATFRSLVDEALRRIPTASRGIWTLHAPVDPGITLVELFAALLEQRSFWADQTTGPLARAVMALFGDRMREARSAGIAITFAPELVDDATRAYSPHAVISRRTALRVPETDVVFTMHQDLLALAFARYATPPRVPVIKLGGDLPPSAEEDLRSGRAIDILSASRGRASAELGFVLRALPPVGVPQPISILFELDSSVHPEWSPDRAPARPPAALRWEYKTAASQWKPLPLLRDGTGGLRRSGTVRFTVPTDWSMTQLASNEWLGWIRVVTDAATFASPPTVLAIVPNSALAYHYQWQFKIDAPGWLPLPARTIQLDAGPLPLPDRTLVFVSEYDGRHRWQVVPDFSRSGPADRHVTVDREHSRIIFGDGLTGRLPRLAPNAVPQVAVVYAAGAGEDGNIPSGCNWQALSGPLPEALSHVAANGGRSAEAIEEARTRAAGELRVPTRAVNPRDHETIARSTPGVAVARAHAEVGFDRGECGVVPGVTTVFVVPGIRSRTRDRVRANAVVAAPVADPGLLDEVRAQFATTRLVGEVVRVESATYRHLRIRVEVTGAPHDRDGVRRRLSAALRLFLDPLLGGNDHEGWPFGQPVRPTALLGVAQRELGDRGDVAAVGIAIDDACEFEACEDVVIRPYELVAVDTIEIAIAATVTTEVGLR